jgi:hypothetical protein
MAGTPLEDHQSWARRHLVLILFLVLGIAATIRTIDRPLAHTVFPVFAGAALHWWDDLPLYDHYPDRTDGFRCSPTYAIAMSPFALLGWTAGGIAWCWVSLAVYLFAVRRLKDEVLPVAWPAAATTAFLVLCLVGGARAIWNGQANPLVIALLLLAGVAVARQWWWLAAVLLAGPIFMKVSPVAVALLFCAVWPRQLIGRLIVVMVAGLALPFLTRPPDVVFSQYDAWFSHLIDSRGERWPGLRDGWTVYLVFERLVGGSDRDLYMTPIDAPIYRAVQLAAAGAALAWCLWLRWRGAATRWLIAGALGSGIAWLMVFGPATEFSTYVLIAPFIAWAAVDAWVRRQGMVTAGLAFTFILVLPWSPIATPLEPVFPPIMTVLPLGAMWFALWLVGAASRRDQCVGVETLPIAVPRRIIKGQARRAA